MVAGETARAAHAPGGAADAGAATSGKAAAGAGASDECEAQPTGRGIPNAAELGNGAGKAGVDQWGLAYGSLGYEIVTRLGARIPRVHL